MAEAVPRVGIGFDVHPRAAGRVLMLGGLRWPGEDGLDGHSDGDAACHALADALLGAGALGDLGTHFPESDASLEGISGTELLARASSILRRAGFTPSSCDLTVICLRPAIGPRADEIRAAIARVLEIEGGSVSVKATRPEGLGLQGDGIGCLAVAVVASGAGPA